MTGTYDLIIQLAQKEAEKKAKQIKEKVEEEAPIKAGKRLVKEIPKYVDNAMNQFYLAYNPEVYVRTYGLYSGVTSGIKTNLSQKYLSITVTSDNVPNHDHDSGEYIFMGGFQHGIHGESAICVEDILDDFVWIVFQNYALYPHMTVLENVMFPLTVGKKKKPKEEAEKIINKMLKR